MKKFFTILLLSFLFSASLFAMKSMQSLITPSTVKVATYIELAKILTKEGGIIDTFRDETGIDVHINEVYDTSELASKIKSHLLSSDVVIGINNVHINDLIKEINKAKIFDYSFLAFCFNTKSSLDPPGSFSDLLKPKYKGKVILIDPRTSSVGQGLLRWSVEALGEKKAFDWWKEAISNSFTLSPSWSQGYASFVRGEAPIVLSYSTSPIVNYLNQNFDIIALSFEEGGLATQEYVASLESSVNLENANRFLDYVVQNSAKIAVDNCMHPVDKDVKLPAAYRQVSIPEKFLSNEYSPLEDEVLLQKWQKYVFDIDN